MQQLQLRTYTREELEEIFSTTRTDSIKRSLQRAGYTFESGGRGKGYTITITGLPDPPTPFEEFARREFECGPQTRIEDMETFFSLLFFHPDFRYYPGTYQSIFMKDNLNIHISAQTLRNWKKKLIDLNWIALDETDCRYYACRKEQKPTEMEMEQYKRSWRKFYEKVARGADPSAERKEIYYKNGGMPRKQCGFAENGVEYEKIDELRKSLFKSAEKQEDLY